MAEKKPGRFSWAMKILNPKAGDHRLEIGCGTGMLGRMIAEKIEPGLLIAIDPSPAMIRKARAAQKPGAFQIIEFVESSLTNLNLKNIVSIRCLHLT